MSQPLLELTAICKSFPGVKALQGAGLRLFAGEAHALLGENGAGKSTLVKVMTGVYRPDSGTLQFEGHSCKFATPLDAQQAGIATVYQEVNLLPNLSVAHNLYLGAEPKRWGLIDHTQMAAQARDLLQSFALDIDVTKPLACYSMAVQQLVAIARGVAQKARVLVLDEPTASLDAGEVQQLFSLLEQLKQQGVAIVFITHFLEQVYRLCERITVLRNGSLVGEFLTADLPRADLIAAMLGRELVPHQPCAAKEKASLGMPLLQTQQACAAASVQQLDLDLPKGQAVGLAGLLGSGRTEVCRLLFGLDPLQQGQIRWKGQPLSLKQPADAIAAGIALCPEDRKTEGIIALLSIRENIQLALQAKQGWWRPISKHKAQQLAQLYIDKLQIATPDADKPIGQLSGGNQQKVILARWLAVQPELLLLDEPTRGIDIGAHAEILQLIHELCEQGMSLLVTSSELEELVAFAHKVVVLRDRQKVAELTAEQIRPDAIMAAIAGIAPSARTSPVGQGAQA
ncbi:sugar ABC transporter ATP-binding protein [Rheinheimera sp.]|uniref:sugar ABC transporter ATP-binding protein n=1 Tax=Rheinheimera sp. TaxID=1869214 RepID=UPI00307E8E04